MKYMTGSDAVRRSRTCAVFALVIAVGILAACLTILFARQLASEPVEATLTISSGEWIEESFSNEILLAHIYLDGVDQYLGGLEVEANDGFLYGEEYDDYGRIVQPREPVTLSLRIPAAKEIQLLFPRNAWAGSVLIDYNGRRQEVLLYSEEDGGAWPSFKGAKNYPPAWVMLLTGCGALLLWCALIVLIRYGDRTQALKPVWAGIARVLGLWKGDCPRARALRLCLFAGGFAVIFAGAQYVLELKGGSIRFEYYEEEPAGSIDVLFLGTSPVYSAVSPVNLWDERGITSFNLAGSLDNAMCDYYMLQYALEHQTPKVVVMDFCALYDDRSPDDVTWEPTYRSLAENIPDKQLKRELIRDIVSHSETQNYIDYYFPLFRYHDRWTDITGADFQPETYDRVSKGGNLNIFFTDPETLSWEPQKPALRAPFSDQSMEYYEKIIQLCEEKGIQLAAIAVPKFTATEYSSWIEGYEEFCEEKGIVFLNYLSGDAIEALQLDLKQDFYNRGHMNVWGNIKLSRDLARRLDDMFDLEDHRGEPGFEAWEEDWEAYAARFADVIGYADAAENGADGGPNGFSPES